MRSSLFLLLGSCAMLAGCSGGGSSGSGGGVIIASPGPTPSPTSTPTPTPTTLNTGEVKPAADATFISATMELTTTGGTSETNGIITGGMTSGRTTTIDTPGFSGSYSATTGYRLSDPVNTTVFGPSQLTIDTTVPNGNGVVLFTKRADSVADYLALYQATTFTSSSKGAGYTTARYGGAAGWQHTVVSGGSGHTRLDYVAYGSATPTGAMPHSGVVKYSILTSGNYATDSALWFLSATTSVFITVDFSTGTISGTIGLAGENFYRSEVGGVGGVPIRGSIVGNSVTGPIVNASIGTSGAVPGQFHLVFVGPNANEVIVTYVANDGAQAAVGAAVGVVDPFAS